MKRCMWEQQGGGRGERGEEDGVAPLHLQIAAAVAAGRRLLLHRLATGCSLARNAGNGSGMAQPRCGAPAAICGRGCRGPWGDGVGRRRTASYSLPATSAISRCAAFAVSTSARTATRGVHSARPSTSATRR